MAAQKRSIGLVVRVLGALIVGLSLLFVMQRILTSDFRSLERVPAGLTVAMIIGGTLVYAANSFLLSAGWWRLLIWFGEQGASGRMCHMVYARTAIARYLPGNVFHVANRHLLGRRFGLRHTTLVGAAVYEIIGVLIAAGAIGILGIGLLDVPQAAAPTLALAAMLAAVLVAPILVNVTIRRLGLSERLGLPERSHLEVTRSLAPILLRYIVFFVIAGLIVLTLTAVIAEVRDVGTALAVVTIFAVSWVAGFITPGAPAGVGVREATMVVAMEPLFGSATSVLIALCFRVITTLGDVVFFLASFGIPQRSSQTANG